MQTYSLIDLSYRKRDTRYSLTGTETGTGNPNRNGLMQLLVMYTLNEPIDDPLSLLNNGAFTTIGLFLVYDLVLLQPKEGGWARDRPAWSIKARVHE